MLLNTELLEHPNLCTPRAILHKILENFGQVPLFQTGYSIQFFWGAPTNILTDNNIDFVAERTQPTIEYDYIITKLK